MAAGAGPRPAHGAHAAKVEASQNTIRKWLVTLLIAQAGLGVAISRKNPRRVLMALRFLLTDSQRRRIPYYKFVLVTR